MDDVVKSGAASPAIRRALVGSFALLILLTGGAILGMGIRSAYRAVDDLSRELITTRAQQIERRLDGFFGPVHTQLRIAREWGRAGLRPLDDVRALNARFVPVLENHPQISSLEIADAAGHEYMLLRSDAGWRTRRLGLDPGVGRALHQRWSDWRTLVDESWIDADYDPKQRPWYRGAMALTRAASTHWTEPYPFFTTREPGVTASMRWSADDGGGIVAFDILLSDITAFTSRLVVSRRGRALVVTRAGEVVGLPPGAAEAAALTPLADLASPALQNAYAAWQASHASGPGAAAQGATFTVEAEGETWWAGFVPYPLVDDLQIAVLVPETDLLGDLRTQRNQVLAITGVALVVAIGLGLALDRALQRRWRGALRRAQRVGQYTLVRKLGDGSMGSVYLARHALLRRATAVKLLREAGDEHALQRFEREVQLTSQLTHPNTIAIYDYGHTPDGTFYYAMEHLEGITLADLIERFGPPPPERVIAILRQVCASLEEAHGRGLIHRDIKPANIMLCERGGRSDVVKVLDFGLVKDLGNETELNLTRSDAITGTPLWVSPEAVAGPDRIEPRSDLYGVGAVGYFLLTGTPVFRGANAWLVCMKHMRQKPEPPSARSEGPVPADLEQVILDCLAKRPDLRPAGAADLADRLAACADAGGWTPERASQWWREHADQLAPSDEGADAVQALSVDLADRKTPPRAF